jgi:vacuole morphology and inheritance protein 14
MADDSASSTDALSPAIIRGIGDRNYEKRKATAQEVTAVVKGCLEASNAAAGREKIVAIINILGHDFTKSRNIHYRKGGLIGLAAVAIGLSSEIDKFLSVLLPPVIECFDDPESRVCYYACESLYNISKVARGAMLVYFNQIFEGLCKLFAHVDIDVKNGANLLDRLIKDIVTEAESFDIETFIPLLQKYIKKTKPYIRMLIVGWISVLDTVPDINMLDYLPDLLEGLFNMLGDGNRDIKMAADSCLAEFLREISQAEVVDFGPMVKILVEQSQSKEKSNRLTAIQWLEKFIALGGVKLINFYSQILESIMFCISDSEVEIRQITKVANQAHMNLIRTTTVPFHLKSLLNILTLELLSEYVGTRVASLQWINMLHEKDPNEINKAIGDLLPALLKAISDPADEVVLHNLQVLARICLDQQQFQTVLNAIVRLFMEERSLLETRGALVIRKLSALLNPRDIFTSLANILIDKPNLEFVSLMVQTLNLIMLTAPELVSLRKSLKDISSATATKEDREMFTCLFKCWCHNSVATFSLCLLSQTYDLSAALIQKLADVNISVGYLMQIDKLIQLLESPVFIHLRLQLLEINSAKQTALLQSLYGLLMLLPQSQAYKTLGDRLATVSALHMHMGNQNMKPREAIEVGKKFTNFVNFDELLDRFESIQEKHAAFRMSLIQQKSLINQSKQSNP